MLKQPLIVTITEAFTVKPGMPGKIQALDGLRGFAMLLIIASHTESLGLKGQGGIGVWLFFTLSGFLLTLPFVNKSKKIQNTSELLRYFYRRIKRIVPFYYFLVTVLFLASRIEFNVFLRHLLFIQADGHFWVLPQLMIFYLILPIILYIISFVDGNKPAIVVGTLILISLVVIFLTLKIGDIFSGNGRQLPLYITPFLLGCVAAYSTSFDWFSTHLKRTRIMVFIHLSAVCIFLSFFVSSNYFTHLIWARDIDLEPIGWKYWQLFSFSSSCFIIILAKCPDLAVTRFIGNTLFRFLAIASFSAYLIHPFVISLLLDFGLAPGVFLLIGTLLVTYFIASVTYLIFEQQIFLKKLRT